ncbi:hypothetical protein AX777_08710 [Sphingobium yanoikuyae]|uniref:Uncharacterized protein n=1 Tax=Sphingobium yanoikuyae TaxID=13690 RepID=A0A177JQ76_SPHYA|nr:hypothetical protein EBF16_12045 [Sphingobium yanoikuyae]KZC80307.1 hypothetical protein AYR46_11845 [Sphingobium yanoikuyae]OAH42944.1 hypothetical protein AX777_08710 [Sphingobium yanoikuyae]RSU74098.1 hypothetical protein BRX37_14405 [Sphingomonas sp. S-NIH.Pt3_0716]
MPGNTVPLAKSKSAKLLLVLLVVAVLVVVALLALLLEMVTVPLSAVLVDELLVVLVPPDRIVAAPAAKTDVMIAPAPIMEPADLLRIMQPPFWCP